MIPIAIYHWNIGIVSRGKGKSAVAAAAYRSGEKLTNEWDGMTHDYTRKGGVVHTEIMLPPHAPPDENEMTITVGVASSAGYTRTYKNVSDNPKVIKLQFYSAFGGVNGTIGEDHRFVIDMPPECEEICFYRYGTFDKILYRDAETGQWMRVE